MSELLSIKNLSVTLQQKKSSRVILDQVSFDLKPGQCLGILGESGSGKSMTAKAILGLLDKSFQIEGEALFEGQDLLQQNKETLRQLRGKEIAMVLQNPMTCFDPLYRIGHQISETFLAHHKMSKEALRKEAITILETMQIRNPEEVLEKYPHQLSGGMLQRVMIGLAMAMKPKLLIADEPTTAIDAITQFAIMKELQAIKACDGMAMLFISHDLGAISCVADEILVHNKGRVADQGTFKEIIAHAKDPYTRLLNEKRQAVLAQYRSILGKGKVTT